MKDRPAGSIALTVLISIVFASAAAAQSPAAPPDKRDALTDIRAAYREGDDERAVVLADRALVNASSSQDRAALYYWRGAALRRLARYQEALVALDAALRLGLKTPQLLTERSIALEALGQEEESKRSFEEVEKLLQEDPERLDLLRKRRLGAIRQEERFRLRIDPTLGFDSNIVAIDEETVLAQGETNRKSFYYGLRLGARLLAFENRRKEMALTLEYQNDLRAYASESGLSYTDNLLSAAFHTRVGKLDWLSLEARAFWGEAFLKDDGHFRSRRGGLLTFLVEPAADWQVRIWAGATDLDYFEEVPEPQDRDGLLLYAGVEATVDLGAGWSVLPYLAVSDFDAEGTDWRHRALDLRLSVRSPELPVAGLRITLAVGHLWADFEEPHSLSDFTEARSDRRLYVRLTISSKALEDLLGFAPGISLAYENWSSNIPAFDFDRWDFGVNADILALSF